MKVKDLIELLKTFDQDKEFLTTYDEKDHGATIPWISKTTLIENEGYITTKTEESERGTLPRRRPKKASGFWVGG